jgi:hypothetical protein
MKTLAFNFRKYLLAVLSVIFISSAGFAVNGHISGPVKSKLSPTKTPVKAYGINEEVINYMASKGMEVLTAKSAGGSGKWIVTAIDVHKSSPKLASSIVTIMIDIGG